MRDPRLDRLAKLLVQHSTRLQQGEVILIDYEGPETRELAIACAEQAVAAGGVPLIEENNSDFTAHFLRQGTESQIQRLGEVMLTQMKQCQAYIGIRGAGNIFEMSGVPLERSDWFKRHVRIPVHLNQRVEHSKWVVLRYPNPSMAQLAERNTREFADFYFRSCVFPYDAMARAAQPLTDLMSRTDRVHITGPGTDLHFSIKGVGVVQCTGECNIPDGEVFTAPVRDSIEGTVKFNCRSTDRATGVAFDDISLTFEAGKVVDLNTADPHRNDALWNILRQDEGASYIGEFAIGFHPHITHPMNDILFDEKIAGSFHMALGNAYKTADNGNRSGLHWDLVQIQRPDFGGGAISFDDVVIRRDGRFILPELEALNPENLGTQNC